MIQFPGSKPDTDPRIALVVPRDTYEDAVQRIIDQAHERDEFREWDGPNAGGINDGPHP